MEKELTKTKWSIDPVHSEIGFKVKYLVFTNVRGTFKEFDASIYTTEEDFMSAEIDFWINPAICIEDQLEKEYAENYR